MSKTTLPKYLYRQDGAKFVLVDDLYYFEPTLLSFPDSYHHGYTFSCLKKEGFKENPDLIPTKTREEHIAEFWASFYKALKSAGGEIYVRNKMTLQEIADTLAENGVRFCHEND